MAYNGVKSVLSEATKVVDTNIMLNCGITMPILGFGTYTITGTKLIVNVIDTALRAGYRSFDTAAVYQNERDIGLALKHLLPKYNLKREDIFITSKLAPKDQGSKLAKEAIQTSLRNLETDYLDLYLIHWPGAGRIPGESELNAKLRAESWMSLIEENKTGRLKSIGVSNYTFRHMQELKTQTPSHLPAINQVEFHPLYDHPKELYEICTQNGILLQSYSTLGGNSGAPLLDEQKVINLAKHLGKDPAQLLLRWALQRGYGIIPKSQTKSRIISNAQLDFVLSEEDVELLNGMSRNKKYSWDPNTIA